MNDPRTTTDGAMKRIGEINGFPVYWAEPGRFDYPGLWYWDGKANVHVPIPPIIPPSTSMMENISIKPRSCGGWIGVFDDGSLRFAVTAESELEAESALQQSLVRWQSVPADALPGGRI